MISCMIQHDLLRCITTNARSTLVVSWYYLLIIQIMTTRWPEEFPIASWHLGKAEPSIGPQIKHRSDSATRYARACAFVYDTIVERQGVCRCNIFPFVQRLCIDSYWLSVWSLQQGDDPAVWQSGGIPALNMPKKIATLWNVLKIVTTIHARIPPRWSADCSGENTRNSLLSAQLGATCHFSLLSDPDVGIFPFYALDSEAFAPDNQLWVGKPWVPSLGTMPSLLL